MLKNKLITFVLSFLALGLLTAKVAIASITPQVSITELNTYVNTNNFKLSYSAMADNPETITAQFYYSKNGGAFTPFGPAFVGASGQVQVNGSEIGEQATYTFRVVINSGAASDETTTIFDNSGPSAVSNYYKEKMGTGSYKLHWKNPSDSDFSKVIIYRGETSDFSSDSSHEVATVLGGAGSDMTYDDTFAEDPNKTYFYNIRAVDKANNSSSLVGDGSSTTTSSSQSGSVLGTTSGSSSQTVYLPKEGGVLGKGADSTSSPEGAATDEVTENGAKTGVTGWLANNKKTALIIAAVLTLIGYLFARSRRQK